jgi:uncharacterized protein (TIGR03435 family)
MTKLLVAALAIAALAQSSQTFEVASIKTSSGGPNDGVEFRPAPGGRLAITNAPLRFLIVLAFRIQEPQLVGGADWIDTARFNISAKSEGNPTTAELFPMLQALLADRFHLRVHHETRELSVYALVAARDGKRGPNLRDSAVDCNATSSTVTSACQYGDRLGAIHGRGIPITRLAIALSPYAGRVVVDRTGISAPQDFDLMWTPESLNTPSGRGDVNAPSLVTALQEQLGLRLDSTKAPVDVLVLDHVERPTPD